MFVVCSFVGTYSIFTIFSATFSLRFVYFTINLVMARFIASHFSSILFIKLFLVTTFLIFKIVFVLSDICMSSISSLFLLFKNVMSFKACVGLSVNSYFVFCISVWAANSNSFCSYITWIEGHWLWMASIMLVQRLFLIYEIFFMKVNSFYKFLSYSPNLIAFFSWVLTLIWAVLFYLSIFSIILFSMFISSMFKYISSTALII